MAIIYIDEQSIGRFVFLSQVGDRSYYTLNRNDTHLTVLVCRNWLALEDLQHQPVDVSLGWDDGTRGFVHDENVGRKHTKITVFREIHTEKHVISLSEVLEKAPKK